MTSSSPTDRHGRAGRGRRAFTLVEMLVVIGIIVVLIGLLMPMVNKAYKNGMRTRMAADLHSIAVGLDAYRQDFRDYPRIDHADASLMAQTTPPPGATVLCWALAGLGGTAQDGADGPGFRMRVQGQGQVYGPYVQLDRFRLTMPKLATGEPYGQAINDRYNQPYLYAPSHAGATITAANGYCTDTSVNTTANPMWDVYELAGAGGVKFNQAGDTLGTSRVQVMLNADPGSGSLRNGQAAVTNPYILWGAGPDELYGPTDPTDLTVSVPHCDDVTNFK